MKSSFCIDLQRFMLIPTKFPLNRQRQVEGALNNGGKQKRAASHKRYSSCLSRDYWTRTSDLAPPRRVRYQLR